ncbi:hypothetical protein N7478_004927 [Penicillium angulare]|uniref:uncharacterized protein n=1 Tax=Penicillium angulare TaxID=116970 RepID=UPI00253FFC92|nr:uncharacterized protein N7478_004927 [Penicillium angulare]KAJ5279555.1 hypothetical protein N7478_004927 [Penicillium angulare]
MSVESPSNLRPRRERSRNGCLCCRRRRKKCDEQKPVCVGCQRNKISCIWPRESDDDHTSESYNADRGYQLEEHDILTGSIDSRIEDFLDIVRTTCAQPGSWRQLESQSSFQEPEHQKQHHDHNNTQASEISRPSMLASPWATMILQDAKSFSFVMSSLRAHSSLHKFHCNHQESRRLVEIACESRAAAINDFRSTVSEITAPNASGTLTFSAIQVILCLEFPIALERHNLINIVDGAYELIVAIRGFFHLQPLTNPYITDSFRSAWMRSPCIKPSSPPQKPEFLRNLSYLSFAIHRLTFPSLEEKEFCLNALAQLYTFFAQVSTTPLDWTALLTWPILLPMGFTDLIHTKRPMALVILAHWFVLVFQNSSHWLLHAWTERIVSGVSNFISPEWQSVLKDLCNGNLSDPLDFGTDATIVGQAIDLNSTRSLQVPPLSINPLLEEFLLLELDKVTIE